MTKAAVTQPEDYANRLQRRIKSLHEEVRTFVANRGNERLRTLWSEWDSRLGDISERTKQRPEVAISLVGGTGSGKSTLLNALIGARVLPVSNMRACTAAICEVAHEEGPYQARIEFVSREAWEHEVSLLLADLRDAKSGATEDDGSVEPAQMSRTVRDKLWTVYRPSEDSSSANFDPFNFVEPAEIKEALDAGFAQMRYADLKEFRKRVARYLDSKHRFWPIVKSVAIRGPFAPLRDGAKIIDLPGLNDPNEAREEVTKNHLKTCRFVWLVFNMKRALTRDAINLMQSDDFLRQVVMDGRADSLTFIGTAADEVDLEDGVEEFGLHEGAFIAEVVSARNRAVRNEVISQLNDLAFQLGTMAHEHPITAAKLAERLKASKIFTVSSREFLRINGLAKTNSAGLDDVRQTEVPALLAHMRQICSGYGVTAHCQGLQRQFQILFEEIKQEIRSQQAMLNSRAEVSQRRREEMRAAVEAAQSFLLRDLGDSRERLVQALESDQTLLAERVKRAVERAKHDLDRTIKGWHRMHWATLKAVCRRGGTHVGSNGRNDFTADLSKPILDGIAFAWSDFFGERLAHTLDKWTFRLLHNAETYRGCLAKQVTSATDPSHHLGASLARVLETTERVLQEVLAQTKNNMAAKIVQDQRTLYESVPSQVKVNMQSAFEMAALESGAGMKQRMVDILSDHANRVAEVMFDDARDAILNGVRGLNDWLAREYDTMIDAVSRSAVIAADNFIASGSTMTQQAIATEQATLSELATMLDRLVDVPK